MLLINLILLPILAVLIIVFLPYLVVMMINVLFGTAIVITLGKWFAAWGLMVLLALIAK